MKKNVFDESDQNERNITVRLLLDRGTNVSCPATTTIGPETTSEIAPVTKRRRRNPLEPNWRDDQQTFQAKPWEPGNDSQIVKASQTRHDKAAHARLFISRPQSVEFLDQKIYQKKPGPLSVEEATTRRTAICFYYTVILGSPDVEYWDGCGGIVRAHV